MLVVVARMFVRRIRGQDVRVTLDAVAAGRLVAESMLIGVAMVHLVRLLRDAM